MIASGEMEKFRIDTHNAVELYLRDPTAERGREIVRTITRWPMSYRLQHAGKVLAIGDALLAKHGAEFSGGSVYRFGQWMIRKANPEWKPTWGDYWLLYWTLTKDRPELARPAIRALHRRGWHLPFADDQPDWAFAQECARRLIKRTHHDNPEFAEAIRRELRLSPCKWHNEIGAA